MTDSLTPPRRGARTSEFWITMLTVVGTIAATIATAPVSAPIATGAALVAAGLAAAGYSVSRGIAKAKQ